MNIKRMLSVVLTIAMVFSTMSFSIVYAEGTGVAYIEGKDGTYETLDAAMDAAAADDTIIVTANIAKLPALSKPVTIKGEGEGGSKIKVTDSKYFNSEHFSLTAGTVRIENFEFSQGGFSTENNSADSSEVTLVFKNCDFKDIAGSSAIQGGASWNNDVLGSLIVENCTFTAGDTYVKGYMVYAQCVKNVSITDCVFDGNDAYCGAIHLGDSTAYATKADINNNTIENFSRGVQLGNRADGTEITIDSNTFDNMHLVDGDTGEAYETAAVYIHENADSEAIKKLEITNNAFTTIEVKTIFSENKTAVSDFNIDFSNNTLDGVDSADVEGDYYIFPATINGKTYVSLEEAYAAAADGDIIQLAAMNFDFEGSVFCIQKKITLQGSEGTVIENGSIRIESSDVIVDGIKFTSPVVIPYGDADPICIDINTGNYDNITISNNIFETAAFEYDEGKRYKGIVTSSSGTYNKLEISGNEFTNLETAITVNPGTTGLLVEENTADAANGSFIKLHAANSAVVTGNKVTDAYIYIRPDFEGKSGTDVVVSENNFSGVYILMDKEQRANTSVNVSRNYWGVSDPDAASFVYSASADNMDIVSYTSYYEDVDAEGNLINLVKIVENPEDVLKSIVLKQDETDKTKIELYIEGTDSNGVKAVIANLVAADIDFAVTEGDFTVTDFVPAEEKWTYNVTADNTYLIRQKGSEDGAADLDGQKIHLGTLVLEGYGKGTLVAGRNAGAIEQRTANNNIVKSTVADSYELEFEIPVPKKQLTVNIDFNNAVKNNAKAYQDMTLTVSGGDLSENIVVKLGTDYEITGIITESDDSVTYADGYTAVLANELTEARAYTVTVSGAGYRTIRKNVTMTDDMTVNFWNNVKDDLGADYLAGDIVKDNKINIYDLSAVVSYFGSDNIDTSAYHKYAKYDLNRDGRIDSKDVAYVLVSWDK